MRHIVWLQDITVEQIPLVGRKAAHLGELMRLHFLVPPGFCITLSAFDHFTDGPHGHAERLSDDALAELDAACRQLIAMYGSTTLFAVRSSAPNEDQAGASFAGQYDTFLNVQPSDVPARVLDCRASLHNRRSTAYRQRHTPTVGQPGMAIIVQVMIPCQVAGVAFSSDPVTGRPSVVIEAGPGLGDVLASGHMTPHRYAVAPGEPLPPGDDLLPAPVLNKIAELTLAIASAFACPQDIEWGLWHNDLYVFQARPMTVSPEGDDIFTETSSPDVLWTAAFFNERFPQPVSPLGWSLLKADIEQLALREPLQFMGTPGCTTWPLTRLYRGHPYANMRVFQTLYKVFPDVLLPEDAYRFFIDRDASLRRKVPYPRGILDPRFLVSMLRHFWHDARTWSPLHNYRLWQHFTNDYDRALAGARQRIEQAASTQLLTIADDIRQLNRRLLAIHRWSLTDADICYSLLCRLIRSWVNDKAAASLAAALVAGTDNYSLRTNQALAHLGRLAAADPTLLQDENTDTPCRSEAGRQFQSALDRFLSIYGHRSPSLDIYHPTFADDRSLLTKMIRSHVVAPIGQATEESAPGTPTVSNTGRQDAERQVRQALTRHFLERLLPLRWFILRGLLTLTRHYLRLREDQRFYWQKGLALLRHIYLRIGRALAEYGMLEQDDDIFFLTASEVEGIHSSLMPRVDQAGEGDHSDRLRTRVALRRRIFKRLNAAYAASPATSYPTFLRGDEPVVERHTDGRLLSGRPLSPGMARGPACIVLGEEDFAAVRPGSILVAPGADPGWTPLFSRISGLVLENGGQLSHGAVVAREYGLPAIAGIPGVTGILRNGEIIVVDGSAGLLMRQDNVSSSRPALTSKGQEQL